MIGIFASFAKINSQSFFKKVDADTYSMTLNNLTGTISKDGSGNFTMALSNNSFIYSCKVSSDYHSLEVLNISGSNVPVEGAGRHYINCSLTSGYRKNVSIFIAVTSEETIIDYIIYF